MRPDQLADLAIFAAITSERSFTGAARKLGVTQSALSQTVKRLESELGFRLLSRTTRSVAPTAAGERLLGTLSPALAGLDAELEALSHCWVLDFLFNRRPGDPIGLYFKGGTGLSKA